MRQLIVDDQQFAQKITDRNGLCGKRPNIEVTDADAPGIGPYGRKRNTVGGPRSRNEDCEGWGLLASRLEVG